MILSFSIINSLGPKINCERKKRIEKIMQVIFIQFDVKFSQLKSVNSKSNINKMAYIFTIFKNLELGAARTGALFYIF